MFKFIASFLVILLAHDALSEAIDCEALVKEGRCSSDWTLMTKHCHSECISSEQDRLQYRRFEIDDDSKDALYDLQLTNATGHSHSFERFEGFVTLIIPIAKFCSGSKVAASDMMASIEELKNVWPFAVEILVFGFEYPSVEYESMDCAFFEAEYTRTNPGRSIYMMEHPAELNGPNADPIFKIIADVMNVEKLEINTAMYYTISPDFSTLENHYGKSLLDMKDFLREMIKELEPRRREL